MRRPIAIPVVLALVLASSPATAGFLAERVDEGIYLVSYQRGQVLRGNVLFDREKKVQKRLVRKSHQFCLNEGFRYLKFPTLGEIAEDDYLRAVWTLGVGDAEQNSSVVEGHDHTLSHVHKVHRLLMLSATPRADFEPCRVDD